MGNSPNLPSPRSEQDCPSAQPWHNTSQRRRRRRHRHCMYGQRHSNRTIHQHNHPFGGPVRLSDRGHHLALAYLFPIIFQHFDESRPPSSSTVVSVCSLRQTRGHPINTIGSWPRKEAIRQVPTERVDHHLITLKRWLRLSWDLSRFRKRAHTSQKTST